MFRFTETSVMKKSLDVLVRLLLLCIWLLLFPTSLRASSLFEAMDRNDDDRLSSIEFRGPARAFRRLDQNRDGYISRTEAQGTRLLEQSGSPQRTLHENTPKKPMYVDTHNHLVGPKRAGKYRFEKSARIALSAMDATDTRINLLLPMPQTVGQGLKLRFEDLIPIVLAYPDRFAALGGGGSLNVMIQEAIHKGHVLEEMKRAFDTRAKGLALEGAIGYGEMTAEHFSMDSKHPYITAPPDHPLFLRLADLAAQYDLPIDIHMEAIPEKMPMPVRFRSSPNPQVLKPNIEAFVRLLEHNRKAKIIWVHLGWDNTGQRTVAMTRKLMSENPNLYMSIRIASGMRKRKVSAPTFPLDENGNLKPQWLALFQEFPDRFIIGSDEIIKPTDDHPSAGSIRSTVGLLEQLPPDLRSKIGFENARRLYRLNRR